MPFAVLENDLKWGPFEQNPNRALDALHWLRDNGIARVLRPQPRLARLAVDAGRRPQPCLNPAELAQRILQRIRNTAAATRGLVVDWDVVNEPVANREVLSILGDAVMADWFRAAKDADPAPRLFINEYDILSANGANLRKQNAYYSMIRMLQERGAPIEGIGMQGHFSSATPA